MRWKKLLTYFGVGAGVIIPTSLLFTVAIKPRIPSPISSYLMSFKNTPENNVFNDYVNKLKSDLKQVLDAYEQKCKEEGIPFNGLNLKYINLRAKPTSEEINYYDFLNRTLKAIDDRLGLTMIQRNPATLEQGFYQRNIELVSFYWSPDYNGLGTWTSFLFQDTYQVPNFWSSLSQVLNNSKKPINEQIPSLVPINSTDNVLKMNWVNSLYDSLSKLEVNFGSDSFNLFEIYKQVNPNSSANQFPSSADLFNFANGFNDKKTTYSIDNIYSVIQNGITSWLSESESNMIQGNILTNPDGSFLDMANFKNSMAGNFVDWTNFNPANLPNIEDGPTSQTTKLVRHGFNVPTNPNAPTNLRDFFIDPSIYNSSKYTYVDINDPFKSTVTALNPAYAEASSPTMVSTFAPLYSWSTLNNPYGSNIDSVLVAQGTSSQFPLPDIINSFKEYAEGDMHALDPYSEYSGVDGNKFYVDIPIRPIPWVDPFNNKQSFLSPQDYYAGFKAYKTSIDVGLSHNGYFIGLSGIDYDKTLSYAENLSGNIINNNIIQKFDDSYINTRPTDGSDWKTWKKFRIYFDKPILSGTTICDILSNQYFAALPFDNQKVKNILIDKPKKEHINNNYFGSGDIKNPNVYNTMWYASPYRITSINDNSIEYTLNESFYNSFNYDVEFSKNKFLKNGGSNPIDYAYAQYSITPEIPKNWTYNQLFRSSSKTDLIKTKKINQIECLYGPKEIQVSFNQFTTGEIDSSEIPQNRIAEVLESKSNNIYSPKVSKLAKSDLIPYNLQVYKKFSISSNDTVNNKPKTYNYYGDATNNKPLYVSSDKYGNMVFYKDKSMTQKAKPAIKDKVSQAYVDLIVSNFWTPNDESIPILERSSIIIREAISNLINWTALAQIWWPNTNKSVQYSYLPYGVFAMNQNSVSPQWNYYLYASNKYGQLKNPSNISELRNRTGGIIKWTSEELEKVFKI